MRRSAVIRARSSRIRLTADHPGRLSCLASLTSPHRAHTADAGGDLRLLGQAPSHVDPSYHDGPDPVKYGDAGMRFEARVRAIATRWHGGCRARRAAHRRCRRSPVASVDGHELQRLRQVAGASGTRPCADRVRADRSRDALIVGRPEGGAHRRPRAVDGSRVARPRRVECRQRPADRRTHRHTGREGPAPGLAAVRVWTLPAGGQQPAGHPAGEPAGYLERPGPPAVELELHAEHQRRDELLARRDSEPRRDARPAAGHDRRSRGDRREDRADELRRRAAGARTTTRTCGASRRPSATTAAAIPSG